MSVVNWFHEVNHTLALVMLMIVFLWKMSRGNYLAMWLSALSVVIISAVVGVADLLFYLMTGTEPFVIVRGILFLACTVVWLLRAFPKKEPARANACAGAAEGDSDNAEPEETKGDG